jgi:hypothetical protein
VLVVVRRMSEVEVIGMELETVHATKLNKIATISKIVKPDFAKVLIGFFINMTVPFLEF